MAIYFCHLPKIFLSYFRWHWWQKSSGEQKSFGEQKSGQQKSAREQKSGEQKSYGEQMSTWEQKSGEQKSGEQKSWEQKSFSTGRGTKVQEQKSGDQKSGERKSFSRFFLWVWRLFLPFQRFFWTLILMIFSTLCTLLKAVHCFEDGARLKIPFWDLVAFTS